MDVTTITSPRSRQHILDELREYLKSRDLDMTNFEVVDGALHACWPELYNNDQAAALLVTMNVFVDLADQEGFEVIPAYLRRAKQQGSI